MNTQETQQISKSEIKLFDNRIKQLEGKQVIINSNSHKTYVGYLIKVWHDYIYIEEVDYFTYLRISSIESITELNERNINQYITKQPQIIQSIIN